LADAIKNNVKDVNVEFIKGSGGAFEVTKDDELIHSKSRTGKFPDEEEIVKKLK
jgi:selT/selW/selH-like putative selenoprotein